MKIIFLIFLSSDVSPPSSQISYYRKKKSAILPDINEFYEAEQKYQSKK
jgi:hypothetical protein